jgi:hypothetical protein
MCWLMISAKSAGENKDKPLIHICLISKGPRCCGSYYLLGWQIGALDPTTNWPAERYRGSCYPMGRGIGAMDPMGKRKDNVYRTNPMGQHIRRCCRYYFLLGWQIGSMDPTTTLVGEKVPWIPLSNGPGNRCHECYGPAERYCGSYYLMDHQKVVVDPTTYWAVGFVPWILLANVCDMEFCSCIYPTHEEISFFISV